MGEQFETIATVNGVEIQQRKPVQKARRRVLVIVETTGEVVS